MSEHPDTTLVIIDTLQMIRPVHDTTYANDYRDLSVSKRLADKRGIAILFIHHLRKEKAEDVFHRISGTTAISGAVDSSFTLVEEKRGGGRARLTCVGRDIDYRELELRWGENNVWELVSDSREQPESVEIGMVSLLSDLLKEQSEWIGTPTELSQKIDPDGRKGITPKKVSRMILQSIGALKENGITAVSRRSNGRRIIELRRAESDDVVGAPETGTIDPAERPRDVDSSPQRVPSETISPWRGGSTERGCVRPRAEATDAQSLPTRASRAFVRLCRTWTRRKTGVMRAEARAHFENGGAV